MKRTVLAAIILITGCTRWLEASDHNGIYALIEQVTLTGADSAAETIQVRGSFALAKGTREYHPPKYGYLYFQLRDGKEDVCRKEWADLKRVAGTGEIVSFGGRYDRDRQPAKLGRVRNLTENPTKPNEYPLNFGVNRVRASDYSPIRNLRYFATPKTPTHNASVTTGRVDLVANPVAAGSKDVQYFFEIKTAKRSLTSPAVSAGKQLPTWSPEIEISPGEKYTWSVWTVSQLKNIRTQKAEAWKGPVASSQFVGKSAQ
ncbi:MAG: hypothetical protein O3A00_13170 [Planctomycetota bacterium]|nr:hypothetical protein [Planctomycetota bacterium]